MATALLTGVLGTIGALGLLTAFGAVVREGVRQGDAERRASSLLAEATWRCRTLANHPLRETCLQRYLQERPTSSAGVQALVITVATSMPR